MGATLRRIISLTVVMVRACADDPVSTERRIWHGFTLNPLSRDYWVPRLERGMTTERFVARLKLAPMGSSPRVTAQEMLRAGQARARRHSVSCSIAFAGLRRSQYGRLRSARAWSWKHP